MESPIAKILIFGRSSGAALIGGGSAPKTPINATKSNSTAVARTIDAFRKVFMIVPHRLTGPAPAEWDRLTGSDDSRGLAPTTFHSRD